MQSLVVRDGPAVVLALVLSIAATVAIAPDRARFTLRPRRVAAPGHGGVKDSRPSSIQGRQQAVTPFPANIEVPNDANGHRHASLIGGRSRRRCVRSWIAGFGVLLAVTSPALAETGWSDEDWTVLTVSRSGAWGLSTARTQGKAIAGALRQCQARSREPGDCGAVQLHYKVGWAIALLCGHHRVMAAAPDRESVEAIANERIAALRQIHGDLPSCRHLLTVNDVGAVIAAETSSR